MNKNLFEIPSYSVTKASSKANKSVFISDDDEEL